jgi:uncharacterized membrane protein
VWGIGREPSAERARSPLWAWPTVAGLLALGAALLLSQVRPGPDSLPGRLWHGDARSAAAVLQVMATSVMTATALTFSVTVVALQLASQQFSPRLLREFSHDPVTKLVLAVLASTFVYTTTALAVLRQDEPVPAVAVAAGYLLGVVSLGAILAFIAHIVKIVRVDTMMLIVHDETERAIAAFYPDYEDRAGDIDGDELDTASGVLVTAATSGFVQRTNVRRLVAVATRANVLIRVEVRAGDHVVRGAPMATVWGADGAADAATSDDVVQGIRSAVELGYERTLDQDAAFGFRQLEDIAVKAMSPSVNDPVTAAHAVGHMTDLLVRLTACRLGSTLHRDELGVGRAVVPDRDLRYYLDLSCARLRRFAAGEPTVLLALLRMLRSVAMACRDDDQRAEVARAAELVVAAASDTMAAHDAQALHDMVERIELGAAGHMAAAFADRAGETRSI